MKIKFIKNKPCFKIRLIILFFCIFGLFTPVEAEDYTSTNFILRDPVVTIEGGRSESASFEYYSSTGQTTIGESTSATYIERSGFLYYPEASSPVISATAGNGQVILSWTASLATLANITDYQLGMSTTSGGTFTYTSVGNITSYTKTGLTNGITYYFKVKAYAGSLVLAASGEISSTPVGTTAAVCGNGTCNGTETCATCPADCGVCGGGGGGGGGSGQTQTGGAVILSGRAYPLSKVNVLKDGQLVATTIAGSDANFTVTVSGLSSGTYSFAVYGEDSKGVRSSMFTFSTYVSMGVTVNIGGIFIAPTIYVDKSEVKKGGNIVIFGQSVPQANITIAVNSEQEFFVNTDSDNIGAYLYNFDTAPLEIGQHLTKSKAALNDQISSFGTAVSFNVGTKNIDVKEPQKCPLKGDVNSDCRVNLVDFSIAAYWYKRPISETFKVIEKDKLSGDGKIDLVDFSIMAYYWTG